MRHKLFVLTQAHSLYFQNLMERASFDYDVYLYSGSSFANSKSIIQFKKLYSYDKKNIFTRGLSWLIFSVQSFLEIWRFDTDSNVLVTSNPPIFVFLLRIILKFKKINVIYLVWDIYPHHLIASRYLGNRSLVYRFFLHTQKKFLKKCSKVLTISNDMLGILRSDFDIDPILFPNFVDTDLIFPKAKINSVKTKLLYSGNLGTTHTLKNLVIAISHFKNLELEVCGSGFGTNELKEVVSTNSISNVRFSDRVDDSLFNDFLNSFNYGIVSQTLGTFNLSSPSKLYPLLASGLGIIYIGPQNSELFLQINQRHGFSSVDTIADINEMLEKIANSSTDFFYNSKFAVDHHSVTSAYTILKNLL